MENIKDYIDSLQNYKDGNYKYESITSLHDVKKAIENGKKIVLIETGAKTGILLGLSLFLIGLIITLILYVFISDIFLTLPILSFGVSLIPLLMFAIPGFIFVISSLGRLREAFLILGAEGIVYKLKKGDIKGFTWKEISMDVVDNPSELKMRMPGLFEILISMPNGDFLHFNQADYATKEFPDKKQIGRTKVSYLLLQAFVLYYNYRKKGTFNTII